MNKRKKKQKRKSVNIENNSLSYFPILTDVHQYYIIILKVLKYQLQNVFLWPKKWVVL